MEKKCGLEVAMLIVPSRSNDSFSSTFIGTNSGEAFFSASPEMYPLLDKFEIFSKNRYLGKILFSTRNTKFFFFLLKLPTYCRTNWANSYTTS